MWKVALIDPVNHKVTLRHSDGETVNLLIPESERTNDSTRKAWLKSQMDQRDVLKAQEANSKAKKSKMKQYLLPAIVALETVAIIILLLRH